MPGILDAREIGGNLNWIHIRRWPIIAVTAGTVAGLVIFASRKSHDPTLLYDFEVRRHGGLGEASVNPKVLSEQIHDFKKHEFGKNIATWSGMMEGERPVQGIFHVGNKAPQGASDAPGKAH